MTYEMGCISRLKWNRKRQLFSWNLMRPALDKWPLRSSCVPSNWDAHNPTTCSWDGSAQSSGQRIPGDRPAALRCAGAISRTMAAVFIAAGPHGILPVGVHEHRRYQHEALYAGQRFADEELQSAPVFFGQHMPLCLQGAIELPPNVVDADHHADPSRREIQHVALPARF